MANRISPAVKEAAFWVGGGECLDAKIGANRYSKFVRVMRVEHVPAALDEAEAKLLPERLSLGA